MNQARVAKIASDHFRELGQFLVPHKAKHVLLPDLYGEMLDVAAVREDANVYIDPRNERLGNEGGKIVFPVRQNFFVQLFFRADHTNARAMAFICWLYNKG